MPNIVPIYALGQHHEGLCIVMKLIGGRSLDQELGGFVADGKALARLVKTLAEAVHYAHQREILHLDLKPSKILIDESGEPYVIGFGLNKRFNTNDVLMPSRVVLGHRLTWLPNKRPARAESHHGHRRLRAGGYPLCLDRRESPVRGRLPGRDHRTGA